MGRKKVWRFLMHTVVRLSRKVRIFAATLCYWTKLQYGTGTTYVTCITCHVTFARNANLLLGVAESAKNGTNLYTPEPNKAGNK